MEERSSDEQQGQPAQSQQGGDSRVQRWARTFQSVCLDPQFILNFLMVVFTGALTVLTFQQVSLSRLDQRAWVGVVRREKPIPLVAGAKHVFSFAAGNSGRTPAMNVKNRTNYLGRPKNERFVPEYKDSDMVGQARSIGVIQPGVEVQLATSPVEANQGHIDALKSGDQILYIYGQTQYDDIFGGTHCTWYCFYLRTDLENMSACDGHNGVSDTKCENIE